MKIKLTQPDHIDQISLDTAEMARIFGKKTGGIRGSKSEMDDRQDEAQEKVGGMGENDAESTGELQGQWLWRPISARNPILVRKRP